MKELAKFEQGIGGDGGTLAGVLGVEESSLVAKVEVKYPIASVVQPAINAFNKAMDKLEQAIPGDWDKPMIAKIKEDFAREIVEALSE